MTRQLIIILLLLLFAVLSSAHANDNIEDTMLMFVGEDTPVVTAASRFPESPLTAPAMVTLISQADIQRNGYRTLGELMTDQPGFFVVPAGRGSVIYFRGLRDAVLFLYDGVPLTTDITKSFAPLDREFSLAAVEQVEIIRGAASVLWGIDAFAAVVNIVPARGAQRPGLHVDGHVGTQRLAAVGAGYGYVGTKGDVYLYGTASRERFSQTRYLNRDDSYSTIEPSEITEVIANIHYRDWLQISGRWSDFRRNYTMNQAATELIWDGEKEAPFNYLKTTATTNIGPSHYSLTAFYHQTDYLLRDADVERRQRNQTTHVELLWDRRIFGRGLITTGTSWRYNDVSGAVIKDGFQPGSLQPDQPLFVPRIDQRDYASQVYSLFSQIRYRWGKAESWIGVRYEYHDEHKGAITTSAGFQLTTSATTQWKILYGSALRTPFSRQLFDAETLKQERISTISTLLAWLPAPDHYYELALFYNHIKYHRAEDPFGGLSHESSRESWGVELSAQLPLAENLTAHAGLSWVDGGSETDDYTALAYSIIRPGGIRDDVYDHWSQPAQTGPEWLARLSLDWTLGVKSNLVTSLRTGGTAPAGYNKGTTVSKYRVPTVVDVTYRRPGFIRDRDQLTLRVSNLFDNTGRQPDVYGPVATEPRRITLSWRINF